MTEQNFEYLDDIFEPCFLLTKETEVEYFNNSFTIFSAHSPRSIKKNKFIDKLITVESIDFKKLVKTALEKNATVITEEVVVLVANEADDRRMGVFKFCPLPDGKVLVYMNDLSIEKRLHEKYKEQLNELKETHAQILQADKLSTLGELTAGISHEISNPLTIANGSAEIIEMCLEGDDLNDDKELIISSLKDITDAHNRINSIIINMKSYLHKGESENEYCQVDEIIKKSAQLVSPAFNDSKVELNIDENLQPILVLANHVKLEQVIVNLLKNALYAISESGKHDGKVKISALKDEENSTVKMIIEDNGPGVPKEIQGAIFNTFFTTKKVGEGTGMGLSISEKIVHSFLGTIELDKDFNNGARFVISFPAIEVNSVAKSEMLQNNMTDVSFDQKKILVVDNEAKVLNLLESFLSELDMKFIGAENAETAMAWLEREVVDLIITDLHLENITGTEFITNVRGNAISTPAIYLSSKDNMKIYNKDKESLGIAGMIIKPFSKDEVVNSIKNFFEEEEDV